MSEIRGKAFLSLDSGLQVRFGIQDVLGGLLYKEHFFLSSCFVK